MHEEQWFYRSSTNEIHGPFSLPELRQLAEQTELTANTAVRSGQGTWKRAVDIPSLTTAFRPDEELVAEVDRMRAEEESRPVNRLRHGLAMGAIGLIGAPVSLFIIGGSIGLLISLVWLLWGLWIIITSPVRVWARLWHDETHPPERR